MSSKLTSQVYDLAISDSQQRILLNLATHAHDDGTHCFPGTPLIAWETGSSERHVRRVLHDLRESGAITTDSSLGGRGYRTEYLLHLDSVPTKEDMGVPKPVMGVRLSRTKRGTSEAEKGDIEDTGSLMGTVIEPSEIPKAHPWVGVFLENERFEMPKPSWIEAVERKHPDMDDLILIAHKCLNWLETNTRGKRRKGFAGTFDTFLRPQDGGRKDGQSPNISQQSETERTAAFDEAFGNDKNWSELRGETGPVETPARRLL